MVFKWRKPFIILAVYELFGLKDLYWINTQERIKIFFIISIKNPYY